MWKPPELERYKTKTPVKKTYRCWVIRPAIYACTTIALMLGNTSCAWYGKSMKDFHTKPLETIRDNPLGAAAAIGTDVAIGLLIAEALDKDGGGGGGAVAAEDPGDTPKDPD